MTSVFRAFVLLLIVDFVITLSKQSVVHSYFENVLTKFMINNRTDARKTEVNDFKLQLRLLSKTLISRREYVARISAILFRNERQTRILRKDRPKDS